MDRRFQAAFGYARSLALLLAFLFAGDGLARVLHLPIPGNVVGMVLLAAALQWRLPVAWVRPSSELLIRHMSLLYIPPGVGVMAFFGLIRREWLPLAAAGVVGTVAVLLVVGLLQQGMERDG